jgi:8-oxo-dGTP pyrophosphatase MutT (NUDIX family)
MKSHFAQYAALPWRMRRELEILLVSTRGRQRWIIPKGWPIRNATSFETAEREAWEEAGVVGRIETKSFGWFAHEKGGDERRRRCLVAVFPLAVTIQREIWPERGERSTRWFCAAEAASLVDNPQLGRLLSEFARRRGLQTAPTGAASDVAESTASVLQRPSG